MNNESQATQQVEEMAKIIANLLESILQEQHNIQAYVEIRKVLKTNQELDGLTIHFEDSNVAPTLYLQNYLSQLQDGISEEAIAAQMAEQVVRAKMEGPEIPEFTLEEAKKSITLTLVNTERNEQLLANVPSFAIGDGELSAIPRWRISDEASFIVNRDIAARLMLTDDEVLQIGQQNINSQQFEIKSMAEIMRDMMIKDGMDEEMLDLMMPTDGPQMIVMSSQNHLQGASVLLSEESLNQVHEMLGDYVILPSSIHEVIAVSITDDMKPDDLRAMVMEVNSTQVAPEDFLSDNIMKYDGRKLKLVMDELKMDTPKIESMKMEERKIHYAGMKMG